MVLFLHLAIHSESSQHSWDLSRFCPSTWFWASNSSTRSSSILICATGLPGSSSARCQSCCSRWACATFLTLLDSLGVSLVASLESLWRFPIGLCVDEDCARHITVSTFPRHSRGSLSLSLVPALFGK